MKVLHTIEGMGGKFGGIATCTHDLVMAIHNQGQDISLLSPSLLDNKDKLLGDREPWNNIFENDCLMPINYSRNLIKWLDNSKFDIYHTNGMWQFIVHETCHHARKVGKPYVMTPHGMLYPETLARSAWKKKLLRKAWFDKDLQKAACIHVTCEDELKHIRALGYTTSIALIANPVDIPDYTKDLVEAKKNNHDFSKKIGYLGRLHPRKKVENLLNGYALSNHSEVEVFIMGEGDNQYKKFLHEEVKRLGIEDKVHFMGFVDGREKFELLANLDALFVPSDMENFGMIIPEALVVATPVMASLGTPWKVLNDFDFGWWRDNSSQTIANVIDNLYVLDKQQHSNMGLRGREYVIENYSSKTIASQMIELYNWILKKGEKPSFVYDD